MAAVIFFTGTALFHVLTGFKGELKRGLEKGMDEKMSGGNNVDDVIIIVIIVIIVVVITFVY